MPARLGQDRIDPDRLGKPPAGSRGAQRALRDALGCFPTGVAVVTGRSAGGTPFGLTINSLASLSLDPPLIAWSLRRTSPLLACFVPATAFAVNVLGRAQEAVARFDCRVADSHVAGDHRLLIGAVERFAAVGGEPLLFVQGAFRSF